MRIFNEGKKKRRWKGVGDWETRGWSGRENPTDIPKQGCREALSGFLKLSFHPLWSLFFLRGPLRS